MASGQVSVDGRGSPDWIPVTAGAKAELGVGMVISTRVSLGRVSGVGGAGGVSRVAGAGGVSRVAGAGIVGKGVAVGGDFVGCATSFLACGTCV